MKLIDCVGFMVEGASGHLENEKERMVKTPWFDYEIPFTQAAEIGTRKVITDHASIGIVVTTDGSFSELRREDYIEPEERTINELKQLNKPFIVLVNSERPYSEEAKKTAGEISEKFGVTAVPMNLEQLKKEDVTAILEKVLFEFPISGMEFFLPKWVEMLADDHKVKVDLVNKLKEKLEQYTYMRDLIQNPFTLDSEFVERIKVDNIDMSSGRIKIYLDVDEAYYYEMLSELLGDTVTSEYQLIGMLQEMAAMRKEYTKVLNAMESVRYKGYGVVTPERSEIVLEKPEVIRHGNKFGVKIKAESPSVHLIRANIETEIAPIVGTQQQAEDLIRYISDADTTQDGIWDTNIFGKTVEQLVNDGISSKIAMIGEESQVKLQETMQKIVNDTNGGIICIII